MRYINIIFILYLTLNCFELTAQEFIVPNVNPISTQNEKSRTKLNTNQELPFYDDFSYLQTEPDPTLWIGNDSYISPNFTKDAPTWGVAVLDAVNAAGKFYETANYETPYRADILTSQPINLDYPDNNTIYLSFFYKAGENGYTPEKQDSLILEFLNVETQNWEKVWFTEGGAMSSFKYVMLQIKEAQYLKSNFQFRFKNYASLGSSVYPDLAINSDHWMIDLVYLNLNRNPDDSTFKDLALTSALSSLLTPYSAMPYNHFLNNPEKYIAEKISVSYKNNDNKIRTIDSLKLSVAEYPTMSNLQTVNGGSYNVPPQAEQEVQVQTGFNFSDTGKDSITLEMKLRLVTDDFDPKRNNSITRKHKLSNYYAYDDGTAEAGYGLYGTGTKYGRLALKFYTEVPAKVTAVNMYFNRSYKDEGRDYFFLNIWQQGSDGFPEPEPAFSQEGIRPEYDNILNTFQTYQLDEPVYVTDTFFVGWTQTQPQMLNVGFDLNTEANEFLYYNIDGAWQPSTIKGSVMIRPIMEKADEQKYNSKKTKKLRITPNPANNQILLLYNNQTNTGTIKYNIYNFTGKIVDEGTSNDNKLNVSNLQNGIYIIKAYTQNGAVYTSKFIVRH